MLNTLGCKQGEKGSDYRFCFKYDACWAKEHEAGDIITQIWANKNNDILNQMNNTREELGPWQYQRYKRMKYKISGLKRKIGKVMDEQNNERSSNLLKAARFQLDYLYDV